MTHELGAAVEFVVERGAVQQFARAAQSEHPSFYGDDAIVPPTFLMSVAHWMRPEDRVVVGFERSRLLHGSQEFRFAGPPPRVGARLVAQERIIDRFEKVGSKGGLMRFAVIATEFHDPTDGSLVAEMRSTLIERGES